MWTDLSAFLQERLQFVLESRGGDRRNVRAVLAARSENGAVPVVESLDNVRALPEFTASEQFQQLATAFKRVRNIARELDDAAAAGRPARRRCASRRRSRCSTSSSGGSR